MLRRALPVAPSKPLREICTSPVFDYLNLGPPPRGEGRKTAFEARPARLERVGAANATAPDVQRVLTRGLLLLHLHYL